MNELVKAAGNNDTFTPKKGSKSYGTIAVAECKITGAESPTATVKPATSAPVETDAEISVAPIPVPVQQFGNMNMGSMPVPVPPPQRPTFVDYPTATPLGYNPHAPPAAFAAAPVMAVPVAVHVVQPPQPFTFQVQVPPGVAPGTQLQIAHPQTGQMLIVPVPQGVPPGRVFLVSA